MEISKKRNNHTHKLRRHKYLAGPQKGREVYYCINNCKFRRECAMSIGVESECNRCGKTFKMNEISVRQAKPHCNECTRGRDKDKHAENILLPTPVAPNNPDISEMVQRMRNPNLTRIEVPSGQTEPVLDETESDLL